MDLSSAWRDIERMDLSTPADGVALNAEQFGYTEKRSADNQAELWNEIFKEPPKYAPAVCGHKVGVADEKQDRHYPLVWVAQKQ